MDYIMLKEAVKKWDISERCAQKLCEEGSIPGVIRFSRAWAIPKNGRSGLGLTIVQKTLKSMNVDFALENTPDGVLFWMDLPKV